MTMTYIPYLLSKSYIWPALNMVPHIFLFLSMHFLSSLGLSAVFQFDLS